MRLSISARIFGGFLVVLIAFGGVMAYTLNSMQRLRGQLDLITRSYVPLTLVVSKINTSQSQLISTLEDIRSPTFGTSRALSNQVRLYARQSRQRWVHQALMEVARARRRVSSNGDRLFLDRLERRLSDLGQGFERSSQVLERLFAEGKPLGAAQRGQLETALLRPERKLARQIRALRMGLRNQVQLARTQVEREENRAVWAILVLIVAALLVSLAVTFGVRLTLRTLKRLVAGTKRIGSGDYAHRVVVKTRDELGVLAAEFNNMAQAVQERERRLIRSERMAAAGRIASHITHEIRNPLSSVSLNTELLEEEFEAIGGGERGAAEARALCQAIRQEVDRLTDLTEEYLRFSRLPRPNLQLEDVGEILGGLLSFMAGELQEQGVRLKVDLARQLPPVEADENQLRQAFLNLVRNAGEAMAGEGGTLTVSAGVRVGQVEVRVADTGPGIEDEHLTHIFDPFFSTKESGTGLGLALTHQIIHEHGGNIEVESEPGEGTVFTILLPAAARPAG